MKVEAYLSPFHHTYDEKRAKYIDVKKFEGNEINVTLSGSSTENQMYFKFRPLTVSKFSCIKFGLH
jgi:hypothetical protein